MKSFKTIDCIIQIIILSIIVASYFRSGGKDAALIFVIGFAVWQVLSSLIHFFFKYKKTTWRLAYTVMGVIILCILLFTKFNIFSSDNFVTFMIILAPIMGVYYFVLCIVETIQLYKNKQLDNTLITD